MDDVIIKVRGAHTLSLTPERGTVHATISLEGAEPEPVMAGVLQQVGTLRDWIDARYDEADGPITWFSIDQIRRNAYRPWSSKGNRKPLVHSATVSIEVKFDDFDVLNAFVVWSPRLEGLSLGHIDWTLTSEAKREREREARQHAVRVARTQAQDYSDALDLGPVAVQRIDDTGSDSSQQFAQRMTLGAADELDIDGAAAEVLTPQHVQISAAVDATFATRAG